MMTWQCVLVIYAWLVAQDYFKELTDQDVRKRLYEEQKNQIEQDMAPFGFIMMDLILQVLWIMKVTDGTLMSMVICHTCGIIDDGY